MTNKLNFNRVAKELLPTLDQYVPIVARVHGNTHSEFHDVRKVFDSVVKKIKNAGSEKPELDGDFAKLREITNSYTVPDDVCESYEAVYKMLSQIDEAYQG